MNADAVLEVESALVRFSKTRGLIVDVRGNAGGARTALMGLVSALLDPAERPLVANLAAYRKWEGFAGDHLAERYLYPVSSSRWSQDERRTLDAFMADFTPEWQLPAGKYSERHAMLISPSRDNQYLDRPVIVLMDSGCFSATDVFLSAVKGIGNVTLMGTPSSGGSACAQVVDLPNSGLMARFATMASFQASGELFDGRGVLPDVRIPPGPGTFVNGVDEDLKRAHSRILAS